MRLLLKSAVACAAAAASAVLACAPAAAQTADCDMLCRLGGYLSADHMASKPEEALPGGASKAKRPRAAAHGTAPKSAAAKAAAPRPVAAVAVAPVLARHTAGTVTAKPALPAHAGHESIETSPPSRTAALPPGWVVGPAPAPPRRDAAVRAAATMPGVAPARAAALRPTPPARTTRTASLSSVIPGSAPAMQAGFH